MIRLVAPRVFYQHTTREDDIFPESESAYEAGEAAKVVWALYGKTDRLANVLRPGKHAISPDSKAAMYAWLGRQLGHEPRDPGDDRGE